MHQFAKIYLCIYKWWKIHRRIIVHVFVIINCKHTHKLDRHVPQQMSIAMMITYIHTYMYSHVCTYKYTQNEYKAQLRKHIHAHTNTHTYTYTYTDIPKRMACTLKCDHNNNNNNYQKSIPCMYREIVASDLGRTVQ